MSHTKEEVAFTYLNQMLTLKVKYFNFATDCLVICRMHPFKWYETTHLASVGFFPLSKPGQYRVNYITMRQERVQEEKKKKKKSILMLCYRLFLMLRGC